LNRYLFTFLLFILSALLSVPVVATSEDTETQQLVDVIYAGRTFVAIRAEAEDIKVKLEPTEAPLWSRASGSLAAVVTSQRLLVATATSPAWLEKPLQVEGEVEPKAYLSADLVFVSSNGRILGYDTVAAKFLEWEAAPAAGPILAVIVEHGLGGIALGREAVGYTGGSDKFVSIPFQPDEVFSSTSVESGAISIVTSMRKLSFDKGSSRWSEAPVPTATPR
jgi:hypothetical protein